MKNRNLLLYSLVLFLVLAGLLAPAIIDNFENATFHRIPDDPVADARTWIAAIRYILGVN